MRHEVIIRAERFQPSYAAETFYEIGFRVVGSNSSHYSGELTLAELKMTRDKLTEFIDSVDH